MVKHDTAFLGSLKEGGWFMCDQRERTPRSTVEWKSQGQTSMCKTQPLCFLKPRVLDPPREGENPNQLWEQHVSILSQHTSSGAGSQLPLECV